jgi:hypothetical protein
LDHGNFDPDQRAGGTGVEVADDLARHCRNGLAIAFGGAVPRGKLPESDLIFQVGHN